MIRTPLVSVIVPTYNFAPYVAESIRSVQSQSVSDIEIIVVDDGSTDNTREILAGIDDPRLVVRTLPHAGVSQARNVGLEIATGEWIGFLDADDRWTPGKLQQQLTLAAAGHLTGVFGNFRRFNAAGNLPRSHFDYFPEMRHWPLRRIAAGAIVEADAFDTFVHLGYLIAVLDAVLLKRAAVADLRFPIDVAIGEDWHYMLRAYERGRFGFVDEVVAEVRRHDSNSYRRGHDIRPFAEALAEVEPLLQQPAHRRQLRRRRGQALLALGYHELWAGRAAASVQAYARAAAYPGARWNAIKHLVGMPVYQLAAWRRGRLRQEEPAW